MPTHPKQNKKKKRNGRSCAIFGSKRLFAFSLLLVWAQKIETTPKKESVRRNEPCVILSRKKKQSNDQASSKANTAMSSNEPRTRTRVAEPSTGTQTQVQTQEQTHVCQGCKGLCLSFVLAWFLLARGCGKQRAQNEPARFQTRLFAYVVFEPEFFLHPLTRSPTHLRHAHFAHAQFVSCGVCNHLQLVLKLRNPDTRVKWADGTVDNEHLGRKSSKSK